MSANILLGVSHEWLTRPYDELHEEERVFSMRYEVLALWDECRGKPETIPKQHITAKMLKHTAWKRLLSQAEEYRGKQDGLSSSRNTR